MTREEYLKIAASKWDSLESLQSEEHFYEFEKKFDVIIVELGREVMEGSIGAASKDRRKKKKLKPDTEQ